MHTTNAVAVNDNQRLHERLRELEQVQRATLNILEDFDEEKAKLTLLQQATMNLLEDFDEERGKYQLIQKATLNLLDDVDEERGKYKTIQKATMNLLEDFDEERGKYQLIHRATMNLLDDVDEERGKSDETQRALLNILDDIEVERANVVHAEHAKSVLEAVNKELEGFSYSVSHDLRAPLRAISGFATVVMEDYGQQLDQEGQRYLHRIQENAGKMDRLIDDLLTFSRLGRQQLTSTPIDLTALAEAVFEELSVDLVDRRFEFTCHEVPQAFGDMSMVRQVLVNLLSNAIKFTSTREVATIEFGHLPGADNAYFVKDNGVGFDMQYVGKLFGVFERLQTDFEGTGVGLALAKRIVSRHGGRVWAEGRLDDGATFFFTLPSTETA